jgi:hypothetical protein
VCSNCRDKPTQCLYTSEPGMPRFASLKARYVWLEAGYNNLSKLHERLQRGSMAEASALVERIRLEDGVPDMARDNGTFAPSMDHIQPSVPTGESANEHGSPQGDFVIPPNRTLSLASDQATKSAFPSQWTCSVDPNLDNGEDGYSDAVSPSAALLEALNRGTVKTSANSRRELLPLISVSHEVLLWPAVSRHIMKHCTAEASSDLDCIRRSGSQWLWQKEVLKHAVGLPSKVGFPTSIHDNGSIAFPSLANLQAHRYTTAYFNTFNVLSPLLDLDTFTSRMATRLPYQSYRDDDPEGVLVYLVLALGQLAVEGVLDWPIGQYKGEYSGFRGGTIEMPPGLNLFNEARRRMSAIDSKCRLKRVQILLLQATYFEASARHSDFWYSVSSASMACVSLIQEGPINWSSSYGDLVKRAYWICVLHERLFDLDLRVASTGIESLEDQVPMPHFSQSYQDNAQPSARTLDSDSALPALRCNDYAYQFTALITLSRLMRRADHVMNGYEAAADESEPLWQGFGSSKRVHTLELGLSPAHYSGPPIKLVQELIRQLDTWRNTLPQRLQWSDNERFGFTEVEPTATSPRFSFFSSLRNVGPSKIDHNVDIAVAQLRTRFYHARFLVHRPFVYKALHARELMTPGDRAKCSLAIDAACLWPLSLAPPKNKKRLVPHLFSWTQNFLAMLLILQMCRTDEYLGDICKEGGVAAEDIEGSIGSMIGWLEDVKQEDGIAEWSLRVLGPALYNRGETSRSFEDGRCSREPV